MATKSLPPYDEFESAAPPSYAGQDASNIIEGLVFPDTVEIYRTTFPHYLLAAPTSSTAPTTQPLSRVNITLSTTAKGIGFVPESLVKVHASADESSKVVGDVKITNSHSADLVIHKAPYRVGSETIHVTLRHPSSATVGAHAFEFARDGSNTKEKFEWVSSACDEAKAIATSNIPNENFSQSDRGYKLISSSSKAVLAVFSTGTRSDKLNPRKISGKLRFLQAPTAGDPATQDENERIWRLLVVLSVLSMIEKTRQSTNKQSTFGAKVAEVTVRLVGAALTGGGY